MLKDPNVDSEYSIGKLDQPVLTMQLTGSAWLQKYPTEYPLS